MEKIPYTIHEEREEIMVSPTGDANPTLRVAHFLRPSIITKPVKDLPPLPRSSKTTSSDLKNLLQEVKFKGWPCPSERWNLWVKILYPTYHSQWKKVGIYDAIMCTTTCKIERETDLILGVAENWCCETNTFIFPWGEATITLEDMMVLGGYSALDGAPVLSPLEIKELKESEISLVEACSEIKRLTGITASGTTWMDHFKARIGCKFEHEAFLSLWLSRYVFPFHCEKIDKRLFPAAILLARGNPVALAPAILAGIYRDLGLLKKKIVRSNKVGTDEDKDDSTLSLTAQFHLVQLWVWERFPSLRPNPRLIECGEPRLAKWHKLEKVQAKNVRSIIDSEGKYFQWRPYAVNNWSFHKFYRENEEWVLVDSDLDKETESFARCMRVSELVGYNCIEQYLPHRVAMQFGLDQDVPGCVFRSNETPEIAWGNYNRPIRDEKLYIPGKLSKSDVTTQYLKWWSQSMLVQQDAIRGVVRKPRSLRSPTHNVKRHKVAKESAKEGTLVIEEMLQLFDKQYGTEKRPVGAKKKEGTLVIEEMLQLFDKQYSIENRPVGEVKQLLKSDYGTLSSSNTSNIMNKEEKLQMKAIQKNVQSEDTVRESGEAREDIHRVKELVQLTDEQHSSENMPVGDVGTLLDSDSRTVLSCHTSNVMNKEEMLPMKSIEKKLQSEAEVKESEEAVVEICRIKELLQITDKQHNTENRLVGEASHLVDSKFRALSSCSMSSVMNNEEKLPMKSMEKNVQSEALEKESEEAVEDVKENVPEIPGIGTTSQSHDNEASSSYSVIEIPELELEDRLNKLQEVVAGLKAANHKKFEKKTRNEGQSDP